MNNTLRLAGNEVPRNLQEVHDRYTPMLVSVALALAEKGLPLNSDEALDLVHDFYIEALPGTLERYDPSRGGFGTYLHRAFAYFAFPRLLQNKRWNEMAAPLDEAKKVAAPDEQPYEPPPERQQAAEALRHLPPELRSILYARLVRGETDRCIATRLNVSRHAVRRTLAEAMGRAAIAIGDLEKIRADLRPFALRLWRDQVPLMTVAQELNLSRDEAWTRYRELIRALCDEVARLREKYAEWKGRKHYV